MPARLTWHPARDISPTPRVVSEDRNQFAGVRALKLDRGRAPRSALDARVEWTIAGDLGGVDSRLGVAGLPRMLQRALTR